MQREPLRDGYWRVTVAVRYDESWSPALALQIPSGPSQRRRQHTKPDWRPKVDPLLNAFKRMRGRLQAQSKSQVHTVDAPGPEARSRPGCPKSCRPTTGAPLAPGWLDRKGSERS